MLAARSFVVPADRELFISKVVEMLYTDTPMVSDIIKVRT